MRDDRHVKRVISRIVPSSTLTHIQFCRVEGGRLRLTVGSAAWIARLRFSERQIIDGLRKEKVDCHTISYHVAPDERPHVRKTVRQPLVAPNAGNRVEEIVCKMPETGDDRLRQELLKLARTLKKRGPSQ